jgi:hypothetical protein
MQPPTVQSSSVKTSQRRITNPIRSRSGRLVAAVLVLALLLGVGIVLVIVHHITTSATPYAACLPPDVSATDLLDSRFGSQGTVASRLQSVGARCASNSLETPTGDPIDFYHVGDCIGSGANAGSGAPHPVVLYLKKYHLPVPLPTARCA